jgi:hypothetical protein
MLDNAGAVTFVTNNLTVWEDVSTAVLRFTNAGALSVDVTADNALDFIGMCDDGLSPIIFDTDGTITDLLLGSGARDRVLGFAGPECGTFMPPEITQSVAVFNGRFIDGSGPTEVPLEDFATVFVHEVGHFLSLDHTQINLAEAFDDDPTNDGGVPTMFPILINGSKQGSLHLDDRVSVSTLYPASSFFSSTGSISGRVVLSDGVTPLQGANVIVRNVANPLMQAVSNVSGARFVPTNPGGPPPANLTGLYEVFGLPSGANYTVEIEQIDPSFVGGSSVGPVDPPVPLPGPPEFWNGDNESSDPEMDDPQDFVTIPVRAGETVTEVDIILNEPVTPFRFRCLWGFYIDRNGTGSDPWDSLLFLANPSVTSHTFEVTVRFERGSSTTTLILVPDELVTLKCEDLRACDLQGWLLVASDAPFFAGTLLLANSERGGSLQALTPSCF